MDITGTLITNNQLNNFNTIFFEFFNTFQRNIIVYKQSTQTPVSNIDPSNFSFGFGNAQTQNAVTYTQVTGSFPALITYPNDQNQDLIDEANVKTTPGGIFIKVKQDAMNFIENGKTTKINVDGRDFEIISERKQKTLLNSILYMYSLQSIDL